MSAREPLWFCHECHAEMRPIMVPDAHCASCNGTFVEKIEDTSDDPREFAHQGPGFLDEDGLPPGMETFLVSLQDLMDRGSREGPRSRTPTRAPGSPQTTSASFEIRSSGSPGTRRIIIGGPNTLGPRNNIPISGARAPGTRSNEGPPTMSEFLNANTGTQAEGPRGRPDITGPLMAQYLMTLIGQHGGDNAFPGVLGNAGGGPAGNGRWGDYVFNQQALDDILSQLMENSNSTRPVAATDEIISNLPREVLEEGSPLLEKECAVCKEQFKTENEDPDEQVVVNLPCKHSFHEGCIVPWLKSSGTCPVCRHALIPQPEHHDPPPLPSSSTGSETRARPPPRRASTGGSGGAEPGGLLSSLFGFMNAGTSGGGNGPGNTSSRPNNDSNARNSRGSGRGANNGNRSSFPGGWDDQVD